MRASKLAVPALLSIAVAACASWGEKGPDNRPFGKHAAMREIAGEVINTGTSRWGVRYIIVKDGKTGLRVYLRSGAESCRPGSTFKARGHLTRANDHDYDATFHLHLTDGSQVCA